LALPTSWLRERALMPSKKISQDLSLTPVERSSISSGPEAHERIRRLGQKRPRSIFRSALTADIPAGC